MLLSSFYILASRTYLLFSVFFFSLFSFYFSFGHTLCDAIAAHTHVCVQWHFALLLQTASKVGHVEFFCEVSFVLFPSDCSWWMFAGLQHPAGLETGLFLYSSFSILLLLFSSFNVHNLLLQCCSFISSSSQLIMIIIMLEYKPKLRNLKIILWIWIGMNKHRYYKLTIINFVHRKLLCNHRSVV